MKKKYDDISGQRFGRLIAICKDGKTKSGCDKWLCQCDCGNTVSVNVYCLVYGDTKSCGCYQRETIIKRNQKDVEDITGKKFGRLLAVEYIGVINGRGSWRCKCDCGAEKIIPKHDLSAGKILSCGCYHNENATRRLTTHGGSKERLYAVWCDMKNRCYNPNYAEYRYYGQRGIFVCEEWKNDYPAFRDWALANGYDEHNKNKECTLDRIDVDKNYCPDNCRWVDLFVQANNKRNNIKIEYNGVTRTIAEWARVLDMKFSTLYCRLIQYNWTIEKAFTTPVKQANRNEEKTNNGTNATSSSTKEY